MVWIPNEKEIAAVLKLGNSERYSYFIKRIVDQKKLWSLWRDGWALAGDDAGGQLVPIWPHQGYAALCAKGEWAGYAPKSIGLQTWMDRWLPGIHQDSRLVAVFPTPSNEGVVVEADRLAHDLNEQLTNY